MDNLKDLLSKVQKLRKCMDNKCSKERKKAEKEFEIYREEIKKNAMDMIHKKITLAQMTKKNAAIRQKMDKMAVKIELTECQLAKCYKETHDLIMKTIDQFLQTSKKNNTPEKTKLIMKYKKIFSKEITVKDIMQYDRDALKMV
jgi:hypothetical protein